MIDSYSKLTIAKYREFTEIELAESDIDAVVNILSLLTDKSPESIMTLPIPEFKELIKKMSFLKEKPNFDKCPNSLVINGQKYYIDKDVKNMSVGQYIDYKQYYKEQDDLIKNLHYIMTIFIIPEGHKYGEGYNLADLAEIFNENLSIETAVGISNFFFRKSEKFIRCFLTYLLLKMRKTARKEKDKEVKAKMMEAVKQMEELRALLKDGFGLIGASGSERYTDADLMKFSTLIS